MKTRIEPVPLAAQATLLTTYLESSKRYMKAIYNLAESLGALSSPKYGELPRGDGKRPAGFGRSLRASLVDTTSDTAS